MEMILIIVVLLLLFGGGGGYWGRSSRLLVSLQIPASGESRDARRR